MEQKIEFVAGTDIYVQNWDKEKLGGFFNNIFPRLKDIGVDAFQSWVRWSKIEPEENKFDFSYYDLVVQLLQKYSLKFTPAIMLGNAFSTPKWFMYSPESLFFRCLEHNTESRCQSIWNPNLKKYFSKTYEKIKQHFGEDIISSLVIGPTSDYGETLYPVSFAGALPYPVFMPPDVEIYHGHGGFWCADILAILHFQHYAVNKYGNLDRINKVWKTKYSDIEEIYPLLKEQVPSDIFWLDQMEWYRNSMTNYCEFILQEARKVFQKPVYLLLGGSTLCAPLGSDFSAQAKLAGKYSAGVRTTMEHSKYTSQFNFFETRTAVTPANFYNSYYGSEPTGQVSKTGLKNRIFNIVSSGGKQYYEYFPNLFKKIFDHPIPLGFEFNPWGYYSLPEDTDRVAIIKKCLKDMKVKRPKVEVATFLPVIDFLMLYPDLDKVSNKLHNLCNELRDLIDYDFLDENLILDGALEKYKVLIVLVGEITKEKVIENILTWTRNGGKLFLLSGCLTRTVDGVRYRFTNKKLGKGIISVFKGKYPKDKNAFISWIRNKLVFMKFPDNKLDEKYTTLFIDGGKIIYDVKENKLLTEEEEECDLNYEKNRII